MELLYLIIGILNTTQSGLLMCKKHSNFALGNNSQNINFKMIEL